MNILIITNLYPTSNEDNSTTKALHNLVKYWTKDNIFVIRTKFTANLSSFLKISKPFTFFNYEGIRGVELPVLKVPKLYCFPNFSIEHIIQKYDFAPDLIISHMPINHILAYKYSQKINKPFAIGIHMSEIKLHKSKSIFNLFNKRKIKDLYKKSQLIICRSHSIYERYIDLFPEHIHKSYIAYSGIDETRIINRKELAEKKEKIKKRGIINIVTVAKLVKLKNLDTVLKALAKLPKDMEWSYTIIGDGPEKNNLEKLAARLNIQDRVCFTGYLPNNDTLKFLEKSDLFVMVSAPETFGLVYLEAMAKGCIVIGTKNWGIDGIVLDKRNGFLVKERDTEVLHSLLENFILNPYYKNDLLKILDESYNTIFNYTSEKASTNYRDIIAKLRINNENYA